MTTKFRNLPGREKLSRTSRSDGKSLKSSASTKTDFNSTISGNEDRLGILLANGKEIERTENDNILISIFGINRYSYLSQKIIDGASKTYKNEMKDVCNFLLENDKKIGRIVYKDEKSEEEVQLSIRDPRTMSTFELFRDSLLLSKAVKQQKLANEKARFDLELLTKATDSYQYEVNCMKLELEVIESNSRPNAEANNSSHINSSLVENGPDKIDLPDVPEEEFVAAPSECSPDMLDPAANNN